MSSRPPGTTKIVSDNSNPEEGTTSIDKTFGIPYLAALVVLTLLLILFRLHLLPSGTYDFNQPMFATGSKADDVLQVFFSLAWCSTLQHQRLRRLAGH